MSAGSGTAKATDIAYRENIYTVNASSPLFLALSLLSSDQGIYRLTVLDLQERVRTVLSGLRVLEVLVGLKGEGIRRRAGKGLEPLLREPIHLCADEYLHKLSHDIPLRGLVSYIMENAVGHVVLVDEANLLRGIVTERCILCRINLQSIEGRVSDIMTRNVSTIESTDTISSAARIMSSRGIRRLPVVDTRGIHEMVTVRSILKHVAESEYATKAVLRREEMVKFLSEPVVTMSLDEIPAVGPETELREVSDRLAGPQFGPLLVTGSPGDILGIITPRDVLTRLPRLVGIDNFIRLLGQQTR